jgi:hypothetical protein
VTRTHAVRLTYGPLWRLQCPTTNGKQTELQVYDVFCMVFLDRPGAYLRIDQVARTNRGRITAELIITQLRTYHRLLHGAQRRGAEVYLTNTEIKDWWMMPSDVRAWIDQRLASEASPTAYDYDYVPFLRSFIPQGRDRGVEFRFFNSLARYLPLLLSADVELRRSRALSSSTFAYGVFATRPLESGDFIQPLQALRGELVPISPKANEVLTRAAADFSVLVLDEEGVSQLRVPGTRGRKRQRVGRGGQAFIVAGGIAFLNHACEEHANIWPAVWEGEGDTGLAQWQVATTRRDVQDWEELFLFYGKCEEEGADRGQWLCTECAMW